MATKRNDTRAWHELRAKIGKQAKLKVRVGIVGDGETATIGLHHEYGTVTIPERSWLRSTFYERAKDLASIQRRVINLVIEGKLDPRRGMEMIGAWAVTAVKRQITTNGTFTPLKPATIARKGSDKPLIDTGQMINAIRFVLVDELGITSAPSAKPVSTRERDEHGRFKSSK